MAETFQTLGPNQGATTRYGTDYPFQAPVPDAVRYLVGDFWLSYPDPACGYILPLQVTRFIGFNELSGNKDLIITDAMGVVVFDSLTDATSRTASPWGHNLVTLAWYSDTTTVRCTMRLAGPPWDPTRTWGADITTVAVLDPRTFQAIPPRLTSLIVDDIKIPAGDLILAEGFNISLTLDDPALVDGGRRTHRILVNATPGNGLGQSPGCDGVESDILTINGIGPDASGNIILDTDGCYRLQRPVTVVTGQPRTLIPEAESLTTVQAASALQFFNDCSPCCTCSDYVAVYEAERKLYNRYLALGAEAESARDTLQANIDRWEAQRACRTSANLNLVLSAERNGVLFVGGLFCNNTGCCLSPVLLRTTFEYFADGTPTNVSGQVSNKCKESKQSGGLGLIPILRRQGAAEVPYTPHINWPVIDTYFDFADTQATSKFRLRLSFPLISSADTVRVTLSVHTPPAINPDGQPCPLTDPTTVTVPAPVATIWTAQPPAYPVRGLIQSSSPVSANAGCC